ncbi:phosphotransferase family protein [Pseudoponticoccus marisrubri]|uniref:Uncharacterized protein n=1 Tax=Pseudoponticoccus marisrubri TaxID=1685382 RepID=A0A0W7WNI8_9RHOB|nr:phosphotransferase [Pseudoponticoccus marisrubri]KUF12162.1 hypothetical protein AVJ23_00015 [Pseudoponticoccus marisrubri]
MRTDRVQEIVEAVRTASERLLGAAPDRIFAPGGSLRDSIRIQIGDRDVILTRRASPGRARLEAECLTRLHAAGAPVPAVLAFDGTWLAQAYVAGTRLSRALAHGTEAERRRVSARAVQSLLAIHDAAQGTGLRDIAPKIGHAHDWIERVARRPWRLSERLDLAPPTCAVERICEELAVRQTRFVKWDARPGNAIMTPAGKVCWIDWEHAGCREGFEDFTWLSADEYFFAGVQPVVDAVRERYATGPGFGPPLVAMATFACLHATVRLELILNAIQEKGWGKLDDLSRRDAIGTSAENLCQLLENGQVWAGQTEFTTPFADWFSSVQAALPMRALPEPPA